MPSDRVPPAARRPPLPPPPSALRRASQRLWRNARRVTGAVRDIFHDPKPLQREALAVQDLRPLFNKWPVNGHRAPAADAGLAETLRAARTLIAKPARARAEQVLGALGTRPASWGTKYGMLSVSIIPFAHMTGLGFLHSLYIVIAAVGALGILGVAVQRIVSRLRRSGDAELMGWRERLIELEHVLLTTSAPAGDSSLAEDRLDLLAKVRATLDLINAPVRSVLIPMAIVSAKMPFLFVAEMVVKLYQWSPFSRHLAVRAERKRIQHLKGLRRSKSI